jgi:hypothetical protein
MGSGMSRPLQHPSSRWPEHGAAMATLRRVPISCLYLSILEDHRRILRDYGQRTGDEFLRYVPRDTK